MVRQNREREIRHDCVLIWRVLVGRTNPLQLITYEELAEKTQIRLSKIRNRSRLKRIHLYCNTEGLGPLDVLVVLARGRQPSAGYFAGRRLEQDYPGDNVVVEIDRARVLASDYTEFLYPRPEEFAPMR